MSNDIFNTWDQPESADRLDLVFADRFKKYGAYQIRKSYRKNKIMATLIACVIALLAAGAPVIIANMSKKAKAPTKKQKVEAKTLDDVDEKEEDKPLEPPPPDKPEPVATQAYVPPAINQNAQEEYNPPPISQIKSPGSKDQQGSDDPWAGDVGSGGDNPINTGSGSGDPLTKVENDAQFPGGDAAFITFVQENFQYPPRCQEEGISADILMKFVVDVDGRVSRISCIVPSKSCPEFTDEAIRVLKKSPRWIPANNNGKFVKAWRTIPIQLAFE